MKLWWRWCWCWCWCCCCCCWWWWWWWRGLYCHFFVYTKQQNSGFNWSWGWGGGGLGQWSESARGTSQWLCPHVPFCFTRPTRSSFEWFKLITQCYSWLPGWVFNWMFTEVPRHGESVVCRACDCQLPPTDVRVDPDLVGKRLKRSLTARIPLILTGSYRARSHSQNVTFQEFQLAVRLCRMQPPYDTLTALLGHSCRKVFKLTYFQILQLFSCRILVVTEVACNKIVAWNRCLAHFG